MGICLFSGNMEIVLGLRTFVLHRLFSSFTRDWKKADHVDFSRENLPRSWGSPGLESAVETRVCRLRHGGKPRPILFKTTQEHKLREK